MNHAKTLMILAHPKIEESIGNKIISELTSKEDKVEIRHLNKLYPDFNINIKDEQQALLNADVIIFQYPLYWYSVPAILKEWIDQVFEYGFAFGKNSRLTNKNIIVSVTIGSPETQYPPNIIDKILYPFKGLVSYCDLTYKGEVLSFNINGYSPESKTKAEGYAKEHASKLIELINS